jgi:3-phenylpropionate/trans-cinnamate dioxygenase ferredoxin subunit
VSRFVRACALDEVAPGTAVHVEVEGIGLALVRIGDDVYALADRCSHANVPLSEGEVYPDTLELECYKHGSAFSLVTGEPHALPATKPVAVYEVRVEDGDVVVEL